MSFGFIAGNFIVAIQLATKIRKECIDVPSQFNVVSDELYRKVFDITWSTPKSRTFPRNMTRNLNYTTTTIEIHQNYSEIYTSDISLSL